MDQLFKFLGPSWKTSLGGAVMIGIAGLEAVSAIYHGQPVNYAELTVHLAAGAALMNARDHKVPDEKAGVAPNPPGQ